MDREYKTTPQWPSAITPLTGAELVEVWQDNKQRMAQFSSLGGVPDAHATSHQFGSTDPVGTHDKVANAIPYLNASGLIDDHVSDASETVPGKVELAEDGESAAGKAVQSDDGRLSDARTPTAHASSHYGVGDDLIPSATTEASGLMSNEDKTLLDNRLPSADEKAALVGVGGTPSASNKYVTDQDGRLPTADQKAALAGTSGYPSITNKFVTDADPRLGGVDIDITDISNWASYYKVFSYDQPTSQTSRYWNGMTSHDGDLYACVGGGDIYKMNSGGVFQPTSQTSRNWNGMASHDGDLYATVFGGDIYKMDGSGVFQPTSQTSRNWYGMASHDGDLYATVSVGDIYKMDSGGVFQPTGQTSSGWHGMASHDGYLYATVSGGYIYKMDGAGVFQPTSQTSRNWYGMASHDGDLYACVDGGDIYKMNSGGVFQPTSQTSRHWNGMASHDGDLYATVSVGDIYKLTTANPTVNLPNVCTRYIPTNFPVNGRKVYRRLAAYDGNAVIIYPPSGATFEGRASISLYGQYSFVEIERISATVFVVRDLRDEYTIAPIIKSGGSSTGATYSSKTGLVLITKGCCKVWGTVALTSKPTTVGAVSIELTGAPIVRVGNAVPGLRLSAVAFTGQLTSYITVGGVSIYLNQLSEAGVISAISNAALANNSTFIFNVVYPI